MRVTVEDAFQIRGRGVVVVFATPNDSRIRTGDIVRLSRPDGALIDSTVRGVEMGLRAPVVSQGILLGLEISKEDVLPGTEIWIFPKDGEVAMPTPIRPLRPGEGPVFQALRLAAFEIDETCFASSLAEERAKPPGWFEDRIREGGLFIAERDGHPLGMLGLAAKTNAKEAHKGFIWSMFVLPEGRGQGLGVALMAAVLDHARDIGLESVQLAVVSTNAPAIAIYEKAGFERYGLEPRSLKTAAGYTDDLLMWKRLR